MFKKAQDHSLAIIEFLLHDIFLQSAFIKWEQIHRASGKLYKCYKACEEKKKQAERKENTEGQKNSSQKG